MFNVAQIQNLPTIIYDSEILSFCLILVTYKEKIDKLKLFDVANKVCF